MRRKKVRDDRALSRRDFARVAALAAAAGPVAFTKSPNTQSQNQPATNDAPINAILNKYGSRLSEEEKTDIKRLVAQMQKTGDALRSFPLDNADEPATVFRVYRSHPKSGISGSDK